LTIIVHMKRQHRHAVVALAGAGVLWGLGVPLSKLALTGVGVGWLTFARFAVAAPLLALVGRRRLAQAASPSVVVSGAVGFGAVVLLQNAGLQRTSVTHAALLVGAVPVLVALIGACAGSQARARMWAGHAIALAGIGLVATSGGSTASSSGDLLVLASSVLSAAFIAISPRLLARHDAAALTAVQFAGGAVVALVAAVGSGEPPPAHVAAQPAIALALLSLATPLPFGLFAFGQARVAAEVAGAFVNLEPVIGAAAGWLAFNEPATPTQLLGALAVLAGIALGAALPRRSAKPRQAGAAGGRIRSGAARTEHALHTLRRTPGAGARATARPRGTGSRLGRGAARQWNSGHGAREHRSDRVPG
jgi:drug/metabolite transporter (DMT)-like permease